MRETTRRSAAPLALAGLLALVLLLLAACGDDAEDAAEPVEEPDVEDVEEDEDDEADEDAAEDDGDAADDDTDDPGELTEISLGQLAIAATVPIYLADREGYFEEEGLDVTFEEFAGGAEILPVLVAGGIDAAFSNHVTTISGVQEGVDFVCVTGSDNSPEEPPDTGNVLVAADSDIATVEDLEGRTIGVNNVRSILTLFFSALLDQNGISPDAVEYVEVPFPNMGDALAADQVDAVGLIEPFNTILAQQGVAEVLTPLYHPVLPGVELGCYGFTSEYIEENPDVVEGFVRAHERGKELAESDRDMTMEAIAEWTGMEMDLVESIVWSSWQPGSSTESMQDIADLMLEYGFIDEEFDASTAVDESFAE